MNAIEIAKEVIPWISEIEDKEDQYMFRACDVEMLAQALLSAKEVIEECRDGFEYTRQYVGYEMLPAIKGWSWFDADEKARQWLRGEV